METPDFDQIARDLLVETGRPWPTVRDAIAVALRQVWNARGAADAEAIDLEAHGVYSEATRTGRTDLEIDIGKVLRKLDR